MNKKLSNRIRQTHVYKKASSDAAYRTTLFAGLSLFVNLIYAVLNCTLGIKHNSAWFFTLFVYYAILSIMRFYAVTCGLRSSAKRTDESVMHFCGWWLCILAVVISAVVWLDFTIDRDASKPFVLMIVIAAYTFWKAILAIININKAHKSKSPLLITLRNINCADAAMSILTLEHAMIATFGESADSFSMTMDGTVGAGAFIIVMGLGISMIIRKRQKE